ncbi:hypothetical protein BXY82_0751 [Gelidibacter sediminis]|uniref:Uncharacterized protein n=1 Tax=Gelidibacter sediminis TaxID=1608710 RepID=A0A4R7Q9B6_9FLAO|nr:hypothetical protein [Gelidibacter sediminis]TDU43340.1 hypothetical protein BXY82_0751 [Gelidibacter sediminis]
MTIFDQLFFNSFNYYKKSAYRTEANRIAIAYITLVQASLLLVLGVFFAEFFQQMHVDTMSSSNAWILFAVASLFLYFKNWIQYSGKKRKIMNAKQQKKTGYGIFTLWLIPVVAIFLAVMFLKVV